MLEGRRNLGLEPPANSSRALLLKLVSLYLLGSLAAVAVVLFLVLLGLEFTGWQWASWLMLAPAGILFYTSVDAVLIIAQHRPIGAALNALDRAGAADAPTLSNAIIRALNLPFLAFLRVTGLHGPLATLMLCLVMFGSNWLLGAGFALWQIGIFAAIVMFFASPTHAILEYFAVSRSMEPLIKRLTQALGHPPGPEYQAGLIAIRLKQKLLYLAIFVAALPLAFFAFSVVFKIQRLLHNHGLNFSTAELMPLYVWIGGVILVCIGGSLIMALLTANEVSRSATRMLAAMRQVERGQLDEARLDVISTDEYADLFRGFGLMVDSLREEQHILAISQDLAGELKLDVLIARIMHAATELLGAERSTLFLYDHKRDELFSFYAEGIRLREIRIPVSQGIAGAVFTSGTLENIANPYADSRFSHEVDRLTGFKTESILCAPIANKAGGRIGVTQVLNKRGGHFTHKDEARLRAFSAQIAVMLENARLFDDVVSMKNYSDSILKSTSNGIITLDADNRIVTANPAALRLLNLESNELLGRAADDAFADNLCIIDSLAKTQGSGGVALAVDETMRCSAGNASTVNLTAAPLIDASDQRIGSMVVIEDITSEKRVRATMARYMSKEVAEQLLAAGEAELEGKDQKVSILFSDVRRFTTLAEALGARETVSMLNEYFTEMVDVIFEHKGVLDKYIGDAIMALFGAPFAAPEDADNALAVADAMMGELARLNAKREAASKEPLDIGIGISTGEVVVGNIGSPRRMEYTVIGDSVNLASRLEGANKYYGTQILLSEFTARELTRPALLREIDLMRVKGKDRPVAVYESLGYRRAEMAGGLRTLLDLYGEGLAAYRARNWKLAIEAFEAAVGLRPGDGPSLMYLDRCRLYAKTPPPADWDGVWVLTDK